MTNPNHTPVLVIRLHLMHKIAKEGSMQKNFAPFPYRGRYFAERAKYCLRHFWGAPGQNFSSLEENQKILLFQEKREEF